MYVQGRHNIIRDDDDDGGISVYYTRTYSELQEHTVE